MHIKERFNIAQSPVREALSKLAAFGLVEAHENKGFRVSAISEADIRDTYAIFTRIENMALELAIENGDESWQARIVSELYTLSLLEKSSKKLTYPEWAEKNYNFHVALISGCNSPTLLEIRRNLYLKFDRYCRMAYTMTKHQLHVNHEEHTELAQAALNRNKKRAKELMTYHINEALEDVIEYVKKSTLI